MLDKYLLDELKRSWLRSDSLEIKTKRVNCVWQHHTNSHAPPFLPLTVTESSDLLRYLGIWSLPLAASSPCPARPPRGHQTLDSPHPGVCQGPSSHFRSHCQYPHNLCVVSSNSIAPHLSVSTLFWKLLITGFETLPWRVHWSPGMELLTLGSWPFLRHFYFFILSPIMLPQQGVYPFPPYLLNLPT